MTDSIAVLTDFIGRIRDEGGRVCDGLDDELARYQAAPATNTICWLLWHTARGLDAQLHDVLGGDQLWADEWAERLGLPLPDSRLGAGATGYGQRPEDVIHVVAPVEDLRAYLEAACEDAAALVGALDQADLDRVVDDSYTPPVTLSVRIVSIITDCLQHLGQAGFLRGIAERAAAE